VDHAATMRNTYDLINAGDIDKFGELLAADFVEHQGGPGYPPTREGTLDFFRDLLVAFPDWHMAVQDLIAGGDKTVARVRVSGTHSGEFIGIPPTGMPAEVELIDIMRFDAAGPSASTGGSPTCSHSCSSSASYQPALRRRTVRFPGALPSPDVPTSRTCRACSR
jgi:predicted ester cyclase